MQNDRSLKSVLKNSPSPTSPSLSFQNTPEMDQSPATSNPLVSMEMAEQKDESLESVLQKTPSPPSPSASLPPSPQNTHERTHYQVATHSKKIVS